MFIKVVIDINSKNRIFCSLKSLLVQLTPGFNSNITSYTHSEFRQSFLGFMKSLRIITWIVLLIIRFYIPRKKLSNHKTINLRTY